MRPTIGALFSIYEKDHPQYLFEALWSLMRGQSTSVDSCVGVIEGPISEALEGVVAEFHEINWLRIPRTQNSSGFGLPESLNYGLQALQTDIVLKVDTDDLNLEDRVEITLEAFRADPELVLFGGQIQEWDPSFRQCFGRRKVPTEHRDILQYAQWRNPFNGPSVAFKRAEIETLGGFPEVGANEDYVLWAAVLARGLRAKNHADDLVYMRGGQDLVARRSNAKTRRGELQALREIGKTGLWNRGRLISHIVSKQVIRRLPDAWNRYIYLKLRQTIPAESPAIHQKAFDAWTIYCS